MIFNAEQTAAALPYLPLAQAIRALLLDASVKVPPRLVHALSDKRSLFVMPASDNRLAITKLITFVADNPARQLPAIQGDVVVFDAANGKRLCMLDGPTVTARRTAAVSLLPRKNWHHGLKESCCWWAQAFRRVHICKHSPRVWG